MDFLCVRVFTGFHQFGSEVDNEKLDNTGLYKAFPQILNCCQRLFRWFATTKHVNPLKHYEICGSEQVLVMKMNSE